MRQIKLTIAATETHCGNGRTRCQYLDPTWPKCEAFTSRDPKWDSGNGEWFRLPECIAAEEAE